MQSQTRRRNRLSERGRRHLLLPASTQMRQLENLQIGMYTGQRLKDCVLMQWQNIDLEQKRIWIKQFKTGKEVLIPIAGPLLPVL